MGAHHWLDHGGRVGRFILVLLLAFYAIWPTEQVVQVAITQYILKTSWEVLATPMTYRIVAFLKRKEEEDFYDTHTNFTPFKVSV